MLVLIPGLVWTAPASAQDDPVGWRYTSAEAAEIAAGLPEVREEQAKHPGAEIHATPRLQDGRWEVSVLAPIAGQRDSFREVAFVLLEDRSGEVLVAWTGPEVGWPMARGEPGAFGGAVNAPWVWVALAALFAAPFVRRRPSIVHLDVLVLLAFSLSYAAFNDANIDLSVPTVYPLLAYLLVRMLWVAWRGRPRRGLGAAAAGAADRARVPDRLPRSPSA